MVILATSIRRARPVMENKASTFIFCGVLASFLGAATTHLPEVSVKAGKPLIVMRAAALFSGRAVTGAVTTTSSRRSFHTRRGAPRARPLLGSLGPMIMRPSISCAATGQRKRKGTETACAPLGEGSIQNVSLPTRTAWGWVAYTACRLSEKRPGRDIFSSEMA